MSFPYFDTESFCVLYQDRVEFHPLYLIGERCRPAMSIKYTEESVPIVESNKLLAYCHGLGISAERLFGEREILVESSMRATV